MILLGITRLALARALRPALLVGGALLLLLALATSDVAHSALAGLDTAACARLARGAWRESAWTALLACILPWLLAQAVRTFPLWRRREIDWLAPRAPAAAALFVSTWLGLFAAALLCALAVALAAECGPARGAPTWSEGGAAFHADDAWVPHERALELALAPELGALPAGTRLELRFAFAGGAAQTEVVARVRAARDGSLLAEGRGTIQARGALEFELPATQPGARVELSVGGPDARLYHEARRARIWIPTAHGWRAALALGARFAVDTGAFLALALGLGAWLGAGTALFTLAALALLALCADVPEGWAPLGGWDAALEVLRAGRVPRLPAANELAGALALLALGLALGASGLRRWRRER